MPQETIHAVISEVLQAAGRPMSAQAIYDAIRQNHLYEFKAKDPRNIVGNQLQRHCIENNHSCAASARYFTVTKDRLYSLLDNPVLNQ